MSKEYTWSFDEHAELWGNDTFDTIEDCVEDAAEYNDEDCQFVFVGEVVPYKTSIDLESMFEKLEEQVYEEVGDAGYDWNAYDYKKQDELEELRKQLEPIIFEWQKKHGYYQEFYRIVNVKRYPLPKKGSE